MVMAGLYRTEQIAREVYARKGSASMPSDALLRQDLICSARRGLVDFTVPISRT
jgi:hypothetical protein